MTGSSGCAARIVRGAVLSLRPLKNVQTSPRRSRFENNLAPEAIVTKCPPDHFEIFLGCGVEASPVGRTTPVRVVTFQQSTPQCSAMCMPSISLFFRPELKLHCSWDTEVSAVMACVNLGRFSQAFLHSFDTPAKNACWLDKSCASNVMTSRWVPRKIQLQNYTSPHCFDAGHGGPVSERVAVRSSAFLSDYRGLM